MDLDDCRKLMEYCYTSKIVDRPYKHHLESDSLEMSFLRFESAMANLMSEMEERKMEPAFPIRLASWCADVIWMIDEARKNLKKDNTDKAESLLRNAKSNLCGFAECLRLLDAQEPYLHFDTEEEILAPVHPKKKRAKKTPDAEK